MKKTLLAAALLAGFAAGAAQAETSVTLYGIIDTGLAYQKIKGDGYSASRIGMVNGVQSGSRWGLRGTEDLGGGLKAVFQLESGFDSGDGDQAQGGRLFGRHATIGLASDNWGRLDFGRQTNITSKYYGDIDPFALGFGQANMGVAFSAANTARWDNMVMYQTPSFGGFQAGVGYSFAVDQYEEFPTNDNVRGLTAGLRYANGPLTLVATYDQLRGNHSENVSAKPKMWSVGGAYDFEVVKVSAAYARTTDGWFTSYGAPGYSDFNSDFTDGMGRTTNRGSWRSNVFGDNFKANSYMVGLSAPIGGATTVMASWQMVDPTKNRSFSGDNEKMNVFSLGATYNLSKRTNLYLVGSYADNYYFVDDTKATTVAAGIRHRF